MEMGKRKRFEDRSPVEKGLIVLTLAVSLAIVAFAERDLQRRPAGEVRGSKLAWRVASLNAVGALAYLGVGRR